MGGVKNNTSISIKSVGGIVSEKYNTGIMGSCHIVMFNNIIKRSQKDIKKILLDIGGFGDRNNSIDLTNKQFEEIGDLKEIDAIIISHDHADHTGNLPIIVKKGYAGIIHMSHTSKSLLGPIVDDQLDLLKKEKEAIEAQNKRLGEKLNKALSMVSGERKNIQKNYSRNGKEKNIKEYSPTQIEASKILLREYSIEKNSDIQDAMKDVPELLFDEKDIMQMFSQIKSHDRNQRFLIDKDNKIEGKFTKAGHLEGAAQTLLSFHYDQYNSKLVSNLLYCGDLGRSKSPLLLDKPTQQKEKIHNTIIESTYGNKLHTEREPEIEKLIEELTNAKGAFIMPAFSLQRTEDILFVMISNIEKGILQLNPGEKIYVDGNLTKKVAKIMLLRDPERYGFLAHPNIVFLEGKKEREAMQNIEGRKIIIAGGGMLQGGSSINNVHKFISNKDTIIATMGYIAEGTRGDYLQKNKARGKWGLVYKYERYKEMKDEVYHPIYTMEKIKSRKQKIDIAIGSAKELEDVIINLYHHYEDIKLKDNEYLYVSEKLWHDERKKDEILNKNGESFNPKKYGEAYYIEKALTKIDKYNPNILKELKNKIKVIEQIEGYDEDNEQSNKNILYDLQGIVMYQDKIGKIPFRARMIGFKTFSGHADRDELISVLENNKEASNHNTILVHGDQHAMNELREHIQKNKKIPKNVIIPELYNTLTIDCKSNLLIKNPLS